MKKIKFEYVRKYTDFETKCIEFYDYYDLLKYLQNHGYVSKIDMQDWELKELSQKKLKKLIIDNFNKKFFMDITEIEVEG
nr:MAG TPA: hypothetical protein [Caudoviricetes sp.]